MNSIHIITATDNKFSKHCAVMLNSLLENNLSNMDIHIYVINGNISYLNQEKLQRAVQRFQKKITFLTVDKSLFKGFKVNKYITIESYYRICIPYLLDDDIEKAIYLDSDIIVCDDIIDLWSVNLNDHFLAAVEDPGAQKYKRSEELSIPPESSYFNAGVLVMNLKKWRENNICNKVIDFIKHNPKRVLFHDQDGLNAILHDKWLHLSPKWNYQTSHIDHLHIIPSIIHYTTPRKPWKHKHPLKKEYFKYSKNTQWVNDL